MILAYLWLRWRIRRALALRAAPVAAATTYRPAGVLCPTCAGCGCGHCGWSGWE